MQIKFVPVLDQMLFKHNSAQAHFKCTYTFNVNTPIEIALNPELYLGTNGLGSDKPYS